MRQSSSAEIKYSAGGQEFTGYLSMPAGNPTFAVLVLHSWWGLTPFFRETCDRLAGEGFVAFAPDLNQGQIAGTIEEAKTLMSGRDFGQTQAAVLGSLEVLRDKLREVSPSPAQRPAQPLGVIGFSMGASWALVLASQAPDQVSCAVLYYGVEGVDFSKVQASFLGHYAEQDEWTPIRWVQQMEADMQEAGLEARFHSYPHVGHWFCEADRPEAYSPDAARLAWERTVQFLHDHLDQR
jgi:carboxymethylenebutenolidase